MTSSDTLNCRVCHLVVTCTLMITSGLHAVDANAGTDNNFAHFDNLQIHYESTGVGDNAIVFVHGWTCDVHSWRAQLQALPNQRVLAIDLPGHGQSDKPRIDYTMSFFARAVEAVMRDAKVECAVLVGHSMGAPIIREFYRLSPQRTTALVIVDGALRPMMPKEKSEPLLEQLRADYRAMSQKMVDGMLTPVRDQKMREQIRASMLATPDYVAISAMQSMTDESLYRPDSINVPMLAVLAKSPFWPADTESFLRSIAPDLEFHMLEGVSHFLMADEPEKFNALLRDFVARHQKPST